jgi:hypothetical protein
MAFVHLSGLCPYKQGCRIRFWGGSVLRVHSVSHSGGMALWMMAGRRDLRLNVESEPWLRGLVFTLPKFYLPWNWICQSEQKESAHGSDCASGSQLPLLDYHIPLMNSMEQSPWAAHSFTASSEIFCFMELRCWLSCSQEPVALFCPSQMNPVYILSVSLRSILILPPLPRTTQVWQNRMSMLWVGGCELFEKALIWVWYLALVVVNILVNAVCWTYCERSFVSLFPYYVARGSAIFKMTLCS